MNLVLSYVPYLCLAPSYDFGDAHVRLRLSVAPALALVLFGLVIEGVDLLALALADDLTANQCALDERGSDNGIPAIDGHHDLAELDCAASVAFQLLNDDDVILCGLVLLAAGLHYRVHKNAPRPETRKELLWHILEDHQRLRNSRPAIQAKQRPLGSG